MLAASARRRLPLIRPMPYERSNMIAGKRLPRHDDDFGQNNTRARDFFLGAYKKTAAIGAQRRLAYRHSLSARATHHAALNLHCSDGNGAHCFPRLPLMHGRRKYAVFECRWRTLRCIQHLAYMTRLKSPFHFTEELSSRPPSIDGRLPEARLLYSRCRAAISPRGQTYCLLVIKVGQVMIQGFLF